MWEVRFHLLEIRPNQLKTGTFYLVPIITNSNKKINWKWSGKRLGQGSGVERAGEMTTGLWSAEGLLKVKLSKPINFLPKGLVGSVDF